MSMSMSIIGQRTKDDTFEKYFKILKACKEVKVVVVPKEVREYFGEACDEYDRPEYIAELALEVEHGEPMEIELVKQRMNKIRETVT